MLHYSLLLIGSQFQADVQIWLHPHQVGFLPLHPGLALRNYLQIEVEHESSEDVSHFGISKAIG